MKVNTRIKHTTLWKLLDPDHFRDKQDFNHILLVTEGTLSDLTQWSLVPEQCREQFFNPNEVLVELAGQEGYSC